MSDTETVQQNVPIYHSSTIAKNRDADTYIWWPPSGLPYPEIIACYNSRVTGPVLASTALQWIELVCKVEIHQIALARATSFKHFNIMRYGPDMRTLSPKLQRDEQLHPGDYICVVPEELTRQAATQGWPSALTSSALMEGTIASRCQGAFMVTAAEHALASGMTIEGKKCLFTGRVGDLEFEWFFPPILWPCVHGTRGIGLPWSTPRKNMTNLYCTDHNLVIMHRDLRQLFYQNVFGIDVDDDFKIYKFQPESIELKSALVTADLPEKLEASMIDKESIPFVRAHFYWTLYNAFLGGSITNDYTDTMIRDFRWEALQLDREDDGLEPVPFDDEIWSSVIGQDIKKLMEQAAE